MKLKKLISSVLTAMLVLSAALPLNASAVEFTEQPSLALSETSESGAASDISEFYSGSNLNAQNYTNAFRHAAPINSYLTECSDGSIIRFQNNNNYSGYLIEYFDSDFNRTESRLIEKELPLFGGFYSTDSFYILLTGQTNYEEDSNTEVFRITKYDKNWKKISSASLYGANTMEPFASGCARMTTCGNYLLIRTCHIMCADKNGVHHQSNVTIEYDISNSAITDYFTDISNSNYGYISHSFNQFIKVENNKIVALDHSDASPRSIVLIKYPTDASTGKFYPYKKCELTDVITFPGSNGANDTGAAIGGFEISDSHYIIAGNNVVDSSLYNKYSAPRNVYVASVSKSSGEVKVNYITDFSTSDLGANNPQFVKLADNRYLLLWSNKGNTSTFYYTEINGNGEQTGSVYEEQGCLSDCVPTIINNKLVWYAWSYDKVTFYQIDVNNLGSCTSKTVSYSSPLINESELASDSILKGQPIKIFFDASGGSGSYKYSVYLKKTTASSWTVIGENLNSAGVSLSYNYPGKYIVRVLATDSNGTSAAKDMELTISTPLENNSSVNNTRFNTGNTVTVTGAAEGGTSPYKYAFYYKKTADENGTAVSSNQVVIGTEFGSAASGSFKPNSAGTYQVTAVIKDSDNTTATKEFTITVETPALVNNSAVNTLSVPAGNPFTLTGNASGGTAPYKYAFYYARTTDANGKAVTPKWTVIGTEFGTAAEGSVKPSSAGTFKLKVVVKDSNNKTAEKEFNVTATPALTNNSTVNTMSIPAGNPFTMTGNASGGTAPYKYAFYYARTTDANGKAVTPKWTAIGTEFGTATTGSVKPSSAGTFKLKVVVKDANNKTAAKEFTVTATPALTNNSTVNTLSVPAGNSFTLTGNASGGTAPYKYAFYYARTTDANGKAVTPKWTAIGTEFGTATTGSVKPSSAGTFKLKVVVKDANNKTAAKEFNVTATPALTNNSTVNSTTVAVGTPFTMTGKASGGTAPYKYAFYYQRTTDANGKAVTQKWTAIGTEFGTATTGSVKPSSAGTFKLKVVVKDANNKTAAKEFTVKASGTSK